MAMTSEQNRIPVGEAVGIVAAQSIGEPGTQMSLPHDEQVLVRSDAQGGAITPVKIGEYVDSIFAQYGHVREGEGPNTHEICDLPLLVGLSVPSLTSQEKIEWRTVSAISRHPSPGRLLRIRLRSGREITATPFHSFVIRRDNAIVPVEGATLKVRDRLPVVRNLSLARADCATRVDAQEVLQSRLKYMVCNNGKLYAYPRQSSKPMASQLELDSQLGWLAGIYLAEGNSTHNYLSISNTAEPILRKVRSFAEERGFSHNEYSNTRGFSIGHDIRINSTLLAEFMKATCGTSSYQKQVPTFAYAADEAFIGAMLRGYFDGDGNVNVQRKVIRASSKSKALIDGISLLLARLGIYATKRPDRRTFNLSVSYRYAGLFLEKIGSDLPERLAAMRLLADSAPRNGYDAVDQIPGIGKALWRASKAAGIPSRLVNSATRRGRIGRSTLAKYVGQLSAISGLKGLVIPELATLRQAEQSDVVWDEIEKLEYVAPSHSHVYDFTVPGSETFATFDGIITHNTMRTFHYAGVAEQVPTGLPRLIELVDARRAPKKPLMDIHLKGAASTDEKKAQAIAKEIESISLDKVAYITEDFTLKKIFVHVDKDELDAHAIDIDTVRKHVKAFAGKEDEVESRENTVSVKPKGASLKKLRHLSTKMRGLQMKGVERITRTIVLKGKNGLFIRTAGSNLAGISKIEGVDFERCYTNDVKEMEKVLGVEAARNSLARELKQVLDMQGLNVDARHCMLLADAMTMEGAIQSVGRHGLSGGKAGVLARAAFEETLKHLVNAATKAEEDKLIGVTENIIVGQLVPVGTGLVKLKMKL